MSEVARKRRLYTASPKGALASIALAVGAVSNFAISRVTTHPIALGIPAITLDIGAVGAVVGFDVSVGTPHELALGITSTCGHNRHSETGERCASKNECFHEQKNESELSYCKTMTGVNKVARGVGSTPTPCFN